MSKTYLFVPGDRPDRFVKADTSGTHATIIDLEDAVGVANKSVAREAVARYLSERSEAFSRVPLYVRINAQGTPWFDDDLAMLKSVRAGCIVLPKAVDPDVVRGVANSLTEPDIILLMETGSGFLNLRSLCQVEGVSRLMLGSVDLAVDLNIADDDLPLHYYRSKLVQHSRAAGLHAPVDGVCTELKNEERLAFEIQRARNFGFGAKACVHPVQIAQVNAGFLPTEAQIDWASRVVAATEQGEAVALDGELIDVPVLERARRILNEGCAPRTP